MRIVFIDTSHFIAFLDRTDGLHDLSVQVVNTLYNAPVRFITSDAVLIELLAYMSRRGPLLRLGASTVAREILAGGRVICAPVTTQLLQRAIDLYEHRSDKTYSLTDCISMIVCRDYGITDVLTSDKDFEQEGFTRLLVAPA